MLKDRIITEHEGFESYWGFNSLNPDICRNI